MRSAKVLDLCVCVFFSHFELGNIFRGSYLHTSAQPLCYSWAIKISSSPQVEIFHVM